MNTDMHPQTDTLKAYLRDIESPEFATLRLHLAQCEDCRNEVNTLSALQQFYPTLPASDANDTPQAIHDYVDDRLSPEARDDVAAQLAKDPATLKAALHYALHSAAMNAELGAAHSPRETAERESGASSWWRQFAQLFELRTPLWMTLPATAAVAAVLAFGVQHFSEQPGGEYVVAAFRDNPVMEFSDNHTQPGIGFFSRAGQSSSAYDNVRIRMTDAGRLTIEWPKVDRALSYTLRLQVFRQKQKITVDEVTTTMPHASFNVDPADTGRRFEWVLSGTTQQHKTFYTTGGFVINKTDQAQ